MELPYHRLKRKANALAIVGKVVGDLAAEECTNCADGNDASLQSLTTGDRWDKASELPRARRPHQDIAESMEGRTQQDSGR